MTAAAAAATWQFPQCGLSAIVLVAGETASRPAACCAGPHPRRAHPAHTAPCFTAWPGRGYGLRFFFLVITARIAPDRTDRSSPHRSKSGKRSIAGSCLRLRVMRCGVRCWGFWALKKRRSGVLASRCGVCYTNRTGIPVLVALARSISPRKWGDAYGQ